MYDSDWVFAQILYTDRHMHTLNHKFPSSVPEAYTHSRVYTHSDRCSLSGAEGFSLWFSVLLS